MENLVLTINDIELPLVGFAETLVDANKATQRPEAYARFKDRSILTNDVLKNLMQTGINTLVLTRDESVIWTGDNYSSILRLSFDINEYGEEYSLVIV